MTIKIVFGLIVQLSILDNMDKFFGQVGQVFVWPGLRNHKAELAIAATFRKI